MKYLTILAFSLIISNTDTCNKKGETIANTREKTTLQTHKNKFEITSLNGKDVSEQKLYIVFDDERNSASGYSGCNTFSCKYTLEKESLSLGFPMATKMYCEKTAELEKEFFTTLIEAKIMIQKEGTLLVKNAEGKELFTGLKSKE